MPSARQRLLVQCVALLIATSCTGDGNDDTDGPFRPILASDEEEQAISDLTRVVQRELDRLRAGPLTEDQRNRLDAAEAKVRRALHNLRVTGRKGQYRGFAMARIGSVAAALIADDVTAVGVANDAFLVVCGITAVLVAIGTHSPATEREVKDAWHRLKVSLEELQATIMAITALSAEACELTAGPALPVEDADAERAQRTEPATDESRRRGPNQKCSDAELDTLQGRADDICKARGQDNTCSPRSRSQKRLNRLRCSEVLRRQAKHEACLAARQQVQKRCFHETDAGHARSISTTADALEWCKALAQQQCAPDSPYNDR